MATARSRPGVRALPFAAAVMATAPLSSTLVARLGIRVVVPAGLTAMGGGLLLLTQVTPTTSYSSSPIGVAIMGAGMGLVMAPAGESIMSVLPAEQYGAGSAVNDTVQELGGSLGIAVIGSVVASSFRHGLATPADCPPARRQGSAAVDRRWRTPSPRTPDRSRAHVLDVAHQSFTSAMTTGFTVAGVIAIAGALIVAIALPRRAASPAVAPATAGTDNRARELATVSGE